MGGRLQSGRDAFARRAWSDARVMLADARDATDLERLAVAAHLVGRDDESTEAWTRAHLAWVGLEDPDHAVRCAVWTGLLLMLRGETAQAGGWLARATRLAEDTGCEGAGAAFLLLPRLVQALEGGDPGTAATLAEEIVAAARRLPEHDLLALGMLGRGQSHLAQGETARGLQALDEVMVSLTTVEVSPITAGIVYCAVIEACVDAFDLRRAAEWTQALHRWCEGQPDLVPYRGQCLVHRSQILQARGAWPDAVAEADRACARLSSPAHPALGLALYQQAELLRLRGDLDGSERAYTAAARQGREPIPGFALLRLAQGQVKPAVRAVRRMLAESHRRPDRAAVLAAAVEILLAGDEIEAAGRAGHELAEMAARCDVAYLRACAEHARGAVLLAEGAACRALAASRRAVAAWREMEMPFELARSRVQVAVACRALGDDDAATLELDAARTTFRRLDARPALAQVDELVLPPCPHDVTAREREVLRLVATGRTNRQIADVLVISEHTVARHLQNVFAKLGLPSRAAATAYAYEHGLVGDARP